MDKRTFVFCLMVLFLSVGEAAGGLFDDLKNSQKAYNERMRIESIGYMSLETMFPDQRVRALVEAAGKGRIKQVKELVAQGVDVNSRGTSNATPLFWAIRNGNLGGFQALLELGADPNISFGAGSNAIRWATEAKDDGFLIAALKHGGNPDLVSGEGALKMMPLHWAAADPDGKNKVRILLDAGAKINAQDGFGYTPVMTAAGQGQFDLVYELLERGADFTIKNRGGKDLAFIIMRRKKTMDPNNALTNWMYKVIEWLDKRGVYLPLESDKKM